MTKTIFWNVDTQYDFMRDGTTVEHDVPEHLQEYIHPEVLETKDFKGRLPVPDAYTIEDNLALLTAAAAHGNIRVVNTADWHDENTEEISDDPDFETTFPPHCLKGTRGAEFIPATRPGNALTIDYDDHLAMGPREEFHFSMDVYQAQNIVIRKDRFDVFGGNPLTEKVLDILRPDRAVVYGVASNVCVDFAVMGLAQRGIEVYVVSDAIKGLPGLPDPSEKWEQAGARLVNTDYVLENMVDQR